MGIAEAYELLERKKKICVKDLIDEFNLSDRHAYRIMDSLLKYDDIKEKWIILYVNFNGKERPLLIKHLIKIG